MKYIDLADEENQGQYPELMAVVEEQGLPYPLVAVNGHLRLAGSAHYYQVLPLVEQALGVDDTA